MGVWMQELTAEDIVTEPARADAILKLVLAPNEGTMKELLVGNSLEWRNHELIFLKESKRRMGVLYKGTHREKRTSGNVSLLDGKAQGFEVQKG